MKVPGNVKLSVVDRVCLLGVLPKEGDFATLKLVRKLRESLSFSEEENKLLNFKVEDGKMSWDVEDMGIIKDVHIGEKMDAAGNIYNKEGVRDIHRCLNTGFSHLKKNQ